PHYMLTKDILFLPSRAESNADSTAIAANGIIDAETATRQAKSAKLRAARIERDASAGNLDKRGMGDVLTLTVAEYRALSPFGRLRYRLYRHPLVLFGLGPIYLFFLQTRLPVGLMRAGWRFWVSAMGTNRTLVLLLGTIVWLDGPLPLLLVFLPTTV